MEFNNTPPSKVNKIIKNKVLSNQLSCDSPLKFLPNESTPPSRFMKIFNPFESHLIDKLHLPTFSPSVFAQISTPKTDANFKWSIDDVSNLRPADIDEATVSQHAFDHNDSHVESIVQEKIDKFFNDKAIVPSPMNNATPCPPLPLYKTPPFQQKIKKTTTSSAQTVLSLPPILPAELEEALKPFCTYTQDQQQSDEVGADSSYYRQLFSEESYHENCSENDSHQSSPPPALDLSPIGSLPPLKDGDFGTPCVPRPNDSLISPIIASKSACRLSFSHMSVDLVPNLDDTNKSLNENESQPNLSAESIALGTSTTNWDMEYSSVFLQHKTPSSRSTPEPIHTDTPHSKIFTSQRKRLSDSFRDLEDFEKDIEMMEEDYHGRNISIIKRVKSRVVSASDTGYLTCGTTFGENSSFDERIHFCASTPTKN